MTKLKFALATDYAAAHKFYLRPPIYASPKLNGVRAQWSVERGQLVSRDNKVFRPDILTDLYTQLRGVTPDLDGELYLHGTPLPAIAGAISVHRREPSELSGRIEFHVFDFPTVDTIQARRVEMLTAWTPPGHLVKVVPHVRITTAEGVDDIYRAYVAAGYEGAVYKHIAAVYSGARTPYWIKRKAWCDVEVRVVGLKPGEGSTNRDTIGALECVMPGGSRFSVTLTEITERDWWVANGTASAPMIKVRYLELTADGIPHQPIYEGRTT